MFINCKLTKKEAQKILSECRSQYESPLYAWDRLDDLNTGLVSEVPLDSGAKVCGKDRHYYLRFYAENGGDAIYPMTIIGRMAPYLNRPFGVDNKYLMSYNEFSADGATWMFQFLNGYIAKVVRDSNGDFTITLMRMSWRLRRPIVIKNHAWNRSWAPFTPDQIASGLQAIKGMKPLRNF